MTPARSWTNWRSCRRGSGRSWTPPSNRTTCPPRSAPRRRTWPTGSRMRPPRCSSGPRRNSAGARPRRRSSCGRTASSGAKTSPGAGNGVSRNLPPPTLMSTRKRVGLLLAMGAVAAGLAAWAFIAFYAPRTGQHTEEPAAGAVRFEDVAERAGVTFRHFDPATPQHLIAETIGCGVAWIDYDADGWPDLFCVQAGPLPPKADPTKTHKLYRNNRDGTFTDVTDAVGLNQACFGVGCAVGDYDNDGFDDLLVTALGGVTLFHNEPDPAAPGGRRFVDVTAAARLAGTNPHYATSCAWGDLDGDGFLDLFVCNYVELDPANPRVCRDPAKGLTKSCPPTAYPVVTPRVYRNRGDG